MSWEIRPTNGTAEAGGGFNGAGSSPGTDYSQQNGVQVAFDGATITATTAGITDTIVITGYTTATTDNRNTVAITGGANFVTGIYEIIAVNTGANTWQLDRNCTSGAGTAMTGNMGGARSGFTVGTTALQSSSVIVAGNFVHIKNEAWNEAVVLITSGVSGGPITFQGYNSSRGDIDPFTSGVANNPTNDRATAAGDGIGGGAANLIMRNINVTRAGDAGFGTSSALVRLENCWSYNNTNEGFETANTWINCKSTMNGGSGIVGAAPAIGCVSMNNTGNAFDGQSFLAFCIAAFNAATNGVIRNPTAVVLNCNSVGNIGANSDGILTTTPDPRLVVMNNISANNGRYGITATDGDSMLSDYNDFFGNGTAARNNVPVGTHDLTSDPQFTNGSTSTNFATTDVDTGADTIAVTVSGLEVGMIVRFTSSGGLPTGLTAGTAYYVIDAVNPIQVSATRGGATVNLSTQGTGTHTIHTPTGLDFTIGTNLRAAGFPGQLQV